MKTVPETEKETLEAWYFIMQGYTKYNVHFGRVKWHCFAKFFKPMTAEQLNSLTSYRSSN
jgi:hypothetical protein